MKATLTPWLVAGAVLMAPHVVHACGACRGPVGPGATLTAPWQRMAAVLVQNTRTSFGRWVGDSYRGLSSAERESGSDWLAGVAIRPTPKLEFAAYSGLGTATFAASGFYDKTRSATDTVLRVRWDAIAEPALDVLGQTPSLGLGLGLRLPTGSVGHGAIGEKGGGGAVLGASPTGTSLGTTEIAAAADVRKTWNKVQLAGILEGALRIPDRVLGPTRMLGPRVLGRAVFMWFASERWTASVFADFGWEGPLVFDGRTVRDSAARSLAIGASTVFKFDNGFRAGVGTSVAPPIDALGNDVPAFVQLSTFVGFAR